LRSPTVFEDLIKLLFTTNTTWAATEAMAKNLVAAAGTPAPSGARAFPTPTQCRRDTAFYRDVVRAGYRAGAALALANAFATGALDDATFLAPQPSPELWQRLVSLHGFGPYAAGQAMRLCGHYDRLALDSWCRARLAAMAGRKRPPADRTVERRYAKFAPFQGLALWCDLTAEWHGEGQQPAAK
jgi:N-glycosylase/DNA lyase